MSRGSYLRKSIQNLFFSNNFSQQLTKTETNASRAVPKYDENLTVAKLPFHMKSEERKEKKRKRKKSEGNA
jgi:hypothetical protein